MLRRWPVLLALALALPNFARADDLADEADFRFRRGAELYAKHDYQGALGEFFTSNRLVHNRNVVFNIGRTLEQLGRVDEAYRWYSSMLDEQIPDADRREVEASLHRLASRVALVRVDSDPEGANIYVDRKDLGVLGQTPRTLALPPRSAKILLELEGHYPAQQAVSPAIGRTVKVKLALPTIYGKVALALSPPQATAHLDREDGPALSNGEKVIPGSHVVWVTAPGHLSQQVVVNVPAEGTAQVKATLVERPPPTGAVVARANVDGALIIVDGKESGFTPGVVEGVVAGPHQVQIAAEGRETFTKQVEVKVNERTFVDAHLRYAGPSVEAATKSLARASDAPGSITVISREEIRAFGYQTLAEALRAVRGIYLSDDRTYGALGFRGISPLGDFNNRVLILVDGHAVYDPWVDQAYVGHELDVDLDQVERIEVVRGGGSALYGTGAVFGVINVVHRGAPEGGHGELEGGVGTLGEEHGRVTGSYGSGRYSVLATAALYDAAGERVYVAPEADPNNGGTLSLNNDGERAFHAGLRARLGDFQLFGELNNRRKDSPTAQYDVLFGEPQRSVDGLGFAEARYDHAFQSGLTFGARAYYDGSRFHGTYPFLGDDGTTLVTEQDTGGADALGAELRLQLPELFHNVVSLGAEGQDQFRIFQTSAFPGSTPFDDRESQRIVGAYINDEVRFSPKFSLVAGVRVDDYLDSFGIAVAPRAAAIGHFYEGSTTKLLASRAFRAPSIYERFFTDYTSQIPNPNLKPEIGLGVELEHTHPFTDEASVTAAVFYDELDGLIDNPQVSDGVSQYRNEPGVVRTYGAELEVRYRPGPNLLLEAWYAYQHTRTDDGSELENSPANTGAARAMVPIVTEVLNFATELIYNSGRLAPPDFAGNRALVGEGLIWNVVFSGSYPRYHLNYQAGVFNMLDQRVELPAAAMQPGVNVAQYGRTFRLTAGFTF